MIYYVNIRIEVIVPEGTDKVLESALSKTLAQHNYPSSSLTLLLTDNEKLRQLNQDFCGKNKPTDVLSFPAGDSVPGFEDEIPYLGDIAISVPLAMNQAQAGEHSLIAELQLLAVHGVLHLLGYDHAMSEDKLLMWSAQKEMLNLLGLHGIEPTEI